MDAAARDIAPPEFVYADDEAVAPPVAAVETRTPWTLPRAVAELG